MKKWSEIKDQEKEEVLSHLLFQVQKLQNFMEDNPHAVPDYWNRIVEAYEAAIEHLRQP